MWEGLRQRPADKNLPRLCQWAALHVIYTNGTQHEVCTVKIVEDAHGRFKNTCSRNGNCSQADKNTWVCKHTLTVVAGIRSGRLELGAGNTETFVPSSAAVINPDSGKALNVAGSPAYYR